MTIYSQISSNKTKTYFIMAIFMFLFTGFFYLIGKYLDSPNTYLILGLTISLASSVVSYFFSDKIILFSVGAVPVKKNDHFDFYTVVENLTLATGLPMPKIYVIDDPAPNAFATGRDPKHAVICATTGLLEKLDRAELEGVIAHELSHIKNYDMLVMTVVAVLASTIGLVSDWIMRSFWWGGSRRRRDNDSERGSPIFFVLLIIALILTPIIATLIQLAISRKREYLADASGVLITRYPEGLARALEKISGDGNILRTASSSTAHLFISNPFKKGTKTMNLFANLFSTHPPVDERIKILRSM